MDAVLKNDYCYCENGTYLFFTELVDFVLKCAIKFNVKPSSNLKNPFVLDGIHYNKSDEMDIDRKYQPVT